jgi:hypothetical protein
MAENQKRILEMLADGKITVNEAERLMALTEPGEDIRDESPTAARGPKKSPKYMRVVVQPDPEGGADSHVGKVNVRIPMNLIRAGIKLTALIPPHAADKVNTALKEHGVDFDLRNIKPEDIEDLIVALGDFEVDVEGNKREKVRIYTE